ncbi:DUF3099 domain-containing protein [Micrococcus aloeverae]|uniref:DUF3099 domain-containing protein n=1 Tax=Micrococcus aloeverae TaxID=1391911 RepID=UPI0007ABC4C4|nr:DUF3099 domain-containing protein [Micrococcus aloeverae]KZE70033.1 hypothetical protein AWM60_06390 [Micrococcus aloeverae]
MTSSAASSRAGRPARAGRGTTPEVQGVTTAAAGRSADREARMKVYLVQMLLRTACFLAALFTHGWWQLGFILGAVVLPYVAVVRVNNTGPQQAGTLRAVPTQGPALAPRPDDTAAPEPVVLTGDLVDDPRDRAPRALGRGSSSADRPGLPGRGAA